MTLMVYINDINDKKKFISSNSCLITSEEMTTYKDTDIREALRRKYADTPQLPADFTERLMQRTTMRPVVNKSSRRWRWIAAAACLLLTMGIGVTMMTREQSEKQTAQSNERILRKADKILANAETAEPAKAEAPATTAPQDEKAPQDKQETVEPAAESAALANNSKSASASNDNAAPAITKFWNLGRYDTQTTDVSAESHVIYASNDTKTDTVPYQDPARVDDFIEKFAGYCKVKEGELQCAVPHDSNVVSKVYVFPDKKELDVFGRLLQVACWYSDETPGYLLSFSHLQFYFELKDLRKQLQYRWIAERVNGKILLYTTRSNINAAVSSACYQSYRDELMHARNINSKPL